MSDQITDLNEAFGKALLQQFFEPIIIGRDPNTGAPFYAQSGVSHLAQQLFANHATKIMDEVWNKIDMDELSTLVANKVVAELIKTPTQWDRRNVHQEKLIERVKEIAAQELGQRVVDAMDLRLGTKELEGPSNTIEEL